MRRELTAAQKRDLNNMSSSVRGPRRYYDDLRYAQTIKERFPTVTSITITHREWIDGPGGGHLPPKERSFEPDKHAVFWQPCASRDCTESRGAESGHDLNEVIREMVRNRETKRDGHSTCMAWQDSRRVGRHRCLTGDEYTIKIKYSGKVPSVRSDGELGRPAELEEQLPIVEA